MQFISNGVTRHVTASWFPVSWRCGKCGTKILLDTDDLHDPAIANMPTPRCCGMDAAAVQWAEPASGRIG